MVTRVNQSTLSVAQRAAFVSAVKALKQAPSTFTPPTSSRYDDYVYMHFQSMYTLTLGNATQTVNNSNWSNNVMRPTMWCHRCPAFLPWHRVFLMHFEQDLQTASGDSTMAIPYWDWTVDQTDGNPPFTGDFMGGDGAGKPITTGPFAGAQWPLTLSQDLATSIVRGFGLFPGAPALPTAADLAATMAQTPYDQDPWNGSSGLESFRNQLEGWYLPPGSNEAFRMHNLVHIWAGGPGGTLMPATSPNDPLFFLHHSNLDRLWALWMESQLALAYAPPNPIPGFPGQGLQEYMSFYDPSLSSTGPWPPMGLTPLMFIDHTSLGYVYDTDPPLAQLQPLMQTIVRALTS